MDRDYKAVHRVLYMGLPFKASAPQAEVQTVDGACWAAMVGGFCSFKKEFQRPPDYLASSEELLLSRIEARLLLDMHKADHYSYMQPLCLEEMF